MLRLESDFGRDLALGYERREDEFVLIPVARSVLVSVRPLFMESSGRAN